MRKQEALICVLKDHPELESLGKELDDLDEEMANRLDWFQKAAKKAVEESDEKRKAIWTRVEDYVDNNKLAPAWYKRKDHNLGFNKSLGILSAFEEEEMKNPLAALLNSLK